jgi:hypothetical protein
MQIVVVKIVTYYYSNLIFLKIENFYNNNKYNCSGMTHENYI